VALTMPPSTNKQCYNTPAKTNVCYKYTSFTERNSSSGKTRCLSKKWAILVVRSYSAMLTTEEDALQKGENFI